jgi:hypothetical protein
MSRLARRWISWLIALVLWCGAPALLIGRDKSSTGYSDEEKLHNAGLETEGPSLLAFFHARSRAAVDPDRLRVLLGQLTSWSLQQRSLATAEFLGLGPLAMPMLRRAANDLSAAETARRGAHCLRWLEGSSSTSLPAAAARVLGKRKPEGAAAALLAYLPFAGSREVLRAVTALALAEANDADAIPVLIDLLTAVDRQCRIFDTSGKQLKAFASGHDQSSFILDLRSNGYILRSRPKLTSVSDASQKRGSPQRFCEASLNLELILGRLLINRRQANKVVEFDREGRLLLLLKTPGPVRQANCRTATSFSRAATTRAFARWIAAVKLSGNTKGPSISSGHLAADRELRSNT